MPNIELVDMCSTSSIADSDLLYAVVCPGGTKADRSITRANAFKGTSAFTTLGAQTAPLNMSTQNITRLGSIHFEDVGESFCGGAFISTSPGLLCPCFGTDINIQVCTCSAIHLKVGDSNEIEFSCCFPAGRLDLKGAHILGAASLFLGAGSITSSGNDFRITTGACGKIDFNGILFLRNEIDLNCNFIQASTTNAADAGRIRLVNGDSINWESCPASTNFGITGTACETIQIHDADLDLAGNNLCNFGVLISSSPGPALGCCSPVIKLATGDKIGWKKFCGFGNVIMGLETNTNTFLFPLGLRAGNLRTTGNSIRALSGTISFQLGCTVKLDIEACQIKVRDCLDLTTNSLLFGVDTSDHLGTQVYVTNGACGLEYNALTGKTHNFMVNNVSELSISNTTANFKCNAITNVGSLNLAVLNGIIADQTLTSSTAGYVWHLPTADQWDFRIGNCAGTRVAKISGAGVTAKAFEFLCGGFIEEQQGGCCFLSINVVVGDPCGSHKLTLDGCVQYDFNRDRLDTQGNNITNVGTLQMNNATIKTISTAVITATQSYHTIAAQTGTTDTLSTINGDVGGDMLVMKADTGDTITVDNAGNILLAGGTMALTANDTITLISDGTNWRETARSVNT